MKEFIEKLIGRLEESEERYDDVSFAQLNEFGHTLDYEYAKGKRDGVAESKEIVNQLAEEYNNGWIPCIERLPKVATSYQVTEEVVINSNKQYVVDIRLFGTEGEWLCPSNRKIIAWMPLPEPFKPIAE